MRISGFRTAYCSTGGVAFAGPPEPKSCAGCGAPPESGGCSYCGRGLARRVEALPSPRGVTRAVYRNDETTPPIRDNY